MANLILETGAGLPNSNSYADLTYADAYFSEHPFHADAWANITDEDVREALLKAGSQFIDISFDWIGYRQYPTQAMEWPRQSIYTDYGEAPLTFMVPERVRQAACEQAFILSKGDPATPAAGAGLTQLRVDVIELTFDKGAKAPATSNAVIGLLRGLAEYSYARRIRKVLVG